MKTCSSLTDEIEKENFPDMELLEEIRKERYEEAEQGVKELWLFLLKDVLPKLCTQWRRKKVQKNHLMSEIVALSDETYMLCVLKKYWKIWKKEVEDKNTPPRTNKTGRRKGATPVSPEYYALQYKIIKEARDDKELAETWERGFQEHIKGDGEEDEEGEDEDDEDTENEDDIKIPVDE